MTSTRTTSAGETLLFRLIDVDFLRPGAGNTVVYTKRY
jgi:hypothetical protein